MHQSIKTLKSGVKRHYYYTERGGKCFFVKDGAPATKAELAGARKSQREPVKPTMNTVDDLIADFQRSPEFRKISASLDKTYRAGFAQISRTFGHFAFIHFTRPRARSVVKRWHQTFAATPRTADLHLTTLVRLLNYAKDEGLIIAHCAADMKRLHSADRSAIIWTDQEISALIDACRTPELEYTIRLAIATGLRREALTKLPVTAIKDGYIEWQYGTGKKKIDVAIPITDEIKACLDWFSARKIERSRITTTVCISAYGRPWTADGLSTSFQKARAAIETDKLFHDFRGTAATRFALLGFDNREIAGFLGWQQDRVDDIICRYVNRPSIMRQNVVRLAGRTK